MSSETPGPSLRSLERLRGSLIGRALAILLLGALDLAGGAASAALGLGPHLVGIAPSVAPLAAAVLAPGFLLAAGAEILVVAVANRTVQERLLALLLAGQVGLLLLLPTSFRPGPAATGAAIAEVALVTGVFIASLQYIYRHKQLSPRVSGYLVRWAIAALVTGLAAAVWAIDGTALLFLPAVGVQVAVALDAGLRGPVPDSEERLPWLLRPFWAFEVLLFTFLAEFFLGALLDYEIAGPGFLQFIPFVPAPGGIAGVGDLVYDGLWFAAAILASAWFLIILGFTLGTLLLLRIRETHEPAQRYRMGLTIAAFALAAVYVPSFASSTPIATVPALANLPVVGWGFGLRAGGPFESGVFLAVLIMYAFVGVLTLLFGRKALCSVMCGAALLYQAGPVNEMRRFNQTSRIGRYYLGSQLSTAYSVAASLALVSLFAVSFLGVLHMLPSVQVANGELDSSALPLPIELYFGGLWFVMFVSTPYVGTYNCATTGICHWGALSLPFARVGLFRLKVKDRSVCQQCTTFDCAKACPVGLVDMPEHFRATGEFRSSKCCGVGDCVGACPYGNMYHQDVRFWLRRKRTGTSTPPKAARLPMWTGPATTPSPTSPSSTTDRTAGRRTGPP